MKSPEVARALPAMVAEGLLTPEQAAPLLAAARGDLVSVRAELRALLGLAVTALTAGVGMWIVEYRERLGPLAIAVLLGLAAAAILILLVRRSPPFTWARAEGRDWTIDGLALLAIGLIGAEIAWIETQFAALGPSWAHHLLLMSLVTGALAIRFDSIPTWTLALATFAAWRGVALMPSTAGQLERTAPQRHEPAQGRSAGREERRALREVAAGADVGAHVSPRLGAFRRPARDLRPVHPDELGELRVTERGDRHLRVAGGIEREERDVAIGGTLHGARERAVNYSCRHEHADDDLR